MESGLQQGSTWGQFGVGVSRARASKARERGQRTVEESVVRKDLMLMFEPM